MNSNILKILPFVFLFYSCDKSEVEKETVNTGEKSSKTNSSVSYADVSYENDISIVNNLAKRKINAFEYSAILSFPEDKIKNEFGSDISSSLYDSLLKQYNGFVYVDLSIDNSNYNDELLKYKIQSAKAYQERISYFAFDFKKEIKLQACDKRTECELYHFERNFGVKSSLNFSLGFKVPEDCRDENYKLIVDDYIFNTGRVKITLFNQKKPKVKFDS